MIDSTISLLEIDLDSPENPSDDLLNRVKKGILKFQSNFPDLLKQDGVLGKQTFNLLNLPTDVVNRIVTGALGDPIIEPSETETPNFTYTIIKDGLPPHLDVDRIIAKCWSIWTGEINLTAEFIPADSIGIQNANVVIKSASLPPTSQGIDVAANTDFFDPPKIMLRHQQVNVRINKEILFTKDLFKYTCLHEFGHVLGIDHTSTPGDMMFKKSQPNIFGLSQNDIDLAVSLWGEPA